MRISPPFLRWFLAYPFLSASSSSSHNLFVSGWQRPAIRQSTRYSCSRCQTLLLRNVPYDSTVIRNQKSLFSTLHNNPDILTSTSSNTVKRFKELQQKAKKRRETGETIIEGPRLILDLLRLSSTKDLVQHILVSTELDENIQQELEDCLQESSSCDPPTITVQKAMPHVLKACSDTMTPQGIVARIKIPEWNLQQVSPQGNHNNKAPLYLVLDGVSDPGNVGTLLRSSVAVGVTAVFLLPGTCDVWNPKSLRGGMTASFLVPSFSMNRWEDAVQQLEEWGCTNLWAATMLEEEGQVLSMAHYDVDWGTTGANALIIGSEGKGLSSEIRQCLVGKSRPSSTTTSNSSAKERRTVKAVHVPMQGAIESLNAAVCGSVILFEYMRQCR